MKLLYVLLVIFMLGCGQNAGQRQQQMESDLKEIDRMQQDRFKYEAKQQEFQDRMELRETINRAKANW